MGTCEPQATWLQILDGICLAKAEGTCLWAAACLRSCPPNLAALGSRAFSRLALGTLQVPQHGCEPGAQAPNHHPLVSNPQPSFTFCLKLLL